VPVNARPSPPSADATSVYPAAGATTSSSRATPASTPRLELEDGSAGVDLRDQPVTLGRGADQTLRIADSRASRAHAVVRPRRTGGWELADDASANGTTLNGHRIPEGKVAPLRDGDRIGIGGVTVLYIEGRAEPITSPSPNDDPTRIA
jgi:pSer/pThr/pTyr-binding forkhead associated (FHA) protein